MGYKSVLPPLLKHAELAQANRPANLDASPDVSRPRCSALRMCSHHFFTLFLTGVQRYSLRRKFDCNTQDIKGHAACQLPLRDCIRPQKASCQPAQKDGQGNELYPRWERRYILPCERLHRVVRRGTGLRPEEIVYPTVPQSKRDNDTSSP